MKKIHVLVSLALAGAFGAAQAMPVDFSGYFRAGNALSTRGGTGTCAGLGGLAGQDSPKWRLGAECDYVIEPNFDATLVKNKDGSEWHVHFMPSAGRGWNDSIKEGDGSTASKTWQGNRDLGLNFGQVYAYGQGVPQLGKGTIWAGRRFYNRVQLGINDHFLENDDGDGVGIDDIDVGGTKLSFAFMNGNGPDSNKSTGIKYIGRAVVQTGGGSSLDIHAKVQRTSRSDDHTTSTTVTNPDPKNGFTSIAGYESLPLGGGSLLAGLRYRTYETKADVKNAWLIPVQYGTSFAGINLDVIGEYEQAKMRASGAGTGTRNMLGFRLDGPIIDIMRWNLESGVINLKSNKNAQKQSNFKVTGALVFVPNSEAAVPRIRFYYTYNSYNAAGAAANLDKWQWGDKKASSTIGAQAEAWW